MVDSILVPLDGSEFAERALDKASELARELRADVVLVTVIDSSVRDAFSGLAGVERTGVLDAVRNHVEAKGGELSEQGLRVSTMIEHSDHSAEKVLEIAETKADPIIVMSSHGRSGLRRWLLGSVAEKILRSGSVPVLVIPIRGEGID